MVSVAESTAGRIYQLMRGDKPMSRIKRYIEEVYGEDADLEKLANQKEVDYVENR